MAIGDQLLSNSGKPELAPWTDSGTPVVATTANRTPGGDFYSTFTNAGGDSRQQIVEGLTGGLVYQVSQIVRKSADAAAYAMLALRVDDANGANAQQVSFRVNALTGNIDLPTATTPDEFGVVDVGDAWMCWCNVLSVASNTRLFIRPNRQQSDPALAEIGDFMVTEWDSGEFFQYPAQYVRTPIMVTHKTQELTFLNQNAWTARSDSSAVDAGSASPDGAPYYTVETVGSQNSFYAQDVTSEVFDGQAMSIQAVVAAGTGDNARIGMWVLPANVQIVVDIDVTSGATTTISGVPTAIRTEDLGADNWRLSFDYTVAAGTDRIMAHLHRGLEGAATTARYTQVNLSIQDGAGIPSYALVDENVSKAFPTKIPFGFSGLTPDYNLDAEFDVFDVNQSDFTYDSTVLVANGAELVTAIAGAVETANTLILFTVDTLAEDISITQTKDFIANGGVLVISTQSGNMLVNTGRRLISGGKGMAWFNYHSRVVFDQYAEEFRTEGTTSATSLSNGNWCFGNDNAGNGDLPDNDAMLSSLGFYFNGSDPLSSVVIKDYKYRACTSAFRSRGAGTIVTYNGFDDGHIEDGFYRTNNTTSAPGARIKTLRHGIAQGNFGLPRLGFLLCNTTDAPWIGSGGFFPFENGETLTQDNGANGIFKATIIKIQLGDGVTQTGWFGNARSIDSPSVIGWDGDAVYYTIDPDSSDYLRAGAPVTSLSASFTPALTVANGAASLFDSGIFTTVVHSDYFQQGAGNDDIDSKYINLLHGVTAIGACLGGGETQFGIPNEGPGDVLFTWYSENIYAGITAERANFLSTTDYVSRKDIFVRGPLGTNEDVNITDRTASYSGALPQVRVLDTLEQYNYKPQMIDSMSGVDTVAQAAIDNGMPFPYLGGVQVVTSTAITGPDNWDERFNYTFPRYQAGDVPAPFVNEAITQVAFVPHNATLAQAKALTNNYVAHYHEPVAGWDYSTDKSGTGWSFPNLIDGNWAGARVGAIRFTDYWVQTIFKGGTVVVPGYTATDGVQILTGGVVVTNTVDVGIVGPQYIQYDVSDAQGNTFTTYSVVDVIEIVPTAQIIDTLSSTYPLDSVSPIASTLFDCYCVNVVDQTLVYIQATTSSIGIIELDNVGLVPGVWVVSYRDTTGVNALGVQQYTVI